MARFAPLILLILSASCAPDPPATEILWDRWGVPHVFARDNADLFRAFGYAQAKAHGDLILKLYGQSRGRAAEYWGEAHLPTDRFVHTVGIPARAAAWYEAQPAEFRGYLDAFAAGFNEYATAHRDRIADSVEVVLPVTATDVTAHTIRVLGYLFPMFGQAELPEGMAASGDVGSNMWAIGPSRSANGHAMLLQNPHLPWGGLFTFVEAHLVSPDRDAYGVTLVGFPTLGIAFNEHLGWSHTVNTQDGADLFRLTRRGDGYLLDGAVKAFDTATSVITVRLPNGSLRQETLRIKRSVHGPVVQEDGGTALALRVAGLDEWGQFQAWWEMTGAKSLAEFEAAVRPLRLPFFNIMYADRDGHIYYFFGGKTPVRSRGDFGYWTPPVRGDSSALLWTETLPYEKLPRVTDPPTGWLQNANDPPWTVTWPLVFDPDTFPAYLSPRSMALRPQRSARMLLEDSSVTFEELVEYKHSTRMELADRILPELLAAARARGNEDARRAADVLERWDRQANADSRGAVLFAAWVRRWYEEAKGAPFTRPWRLDSALTTPAGLRDPRAAVAALGKSAREVRKKYGALDVPWGEVMRIRYGGRDLPGDGAGDPLGVFRVANYIPDDDGKQRLFAGDSYYAAIEFGDSLRARVLLAYGNATQPGSRHRGDQLELFARKEMRDVWRTRGEIERNLEEREELPSTGRR